MASRIIFSMFIPSFNFVEEQTPVRSISSRKWYKIELLAEKRIYTSVVFPLCSQELP
jgi:hypothetical protein